MATWINEDACVCIDCGNMNKYKAKEPGFFLCKICGRADSPVNWTKGSLENGLCLSCSIWTRIKKAYDRGRKVVIDGRVYHVSNENDPSHFRGFGGRKFKIEMIETGRIIDTTNLWHNGTIPDRFRKGMPDNAKFVNEKENK
jgi:hypothetical protein